MNESSTAELMVENSFCFLSENMFVITSLSLTSSVHRFVPSELFFINWTRSRKFRDLTEKRIKLLKPVCFSYQIIIIIRLLHCWTRPFLVANIWIGLCPATGLSNNIRHSGRLFGYSYLLL